MIYIFFASAIILILMIASRKSSDANYNALIEHDAKRFAMLLFAEIRLSNGYKLQRGLMKNNLYESLNIEINEARQKFRKRCPGSNLEIIFDSALLEILASGDKSKFGFENDKISIK